MNNQLIYSIANFKFCIYTSDKDRARYNMPSYEPFLLDIKGEKSTSNVDILFEFHDEQTISIAKADLIDKSDFNNGIASIYYGDGYYYVEIVSPEQQVCLMKADKNWKKIETNLSLINFTDSVYMKNFIMMAFVMATAPLKTLKIHASVIEKDGNALLFLGKSGTGKSTHSSLWLKYVPGCSLLNDDTPIVRVLPDGLVRAYGAPWSGSTPCYRNISAEIKGFVHLYQHPENKLSKLNAIQATSSLMESSGTMRFNQENLNQVFNTVSDILQTIPVYRLDCRPDKEAVELTRKLLNA